jgi:hypothetical protein
MYKRCLDFLKEAYENKIDEYNQPKIHHNIRLSLNFHEEVLKCAALLHDVLEDGRYTDKYLIGIAIDRRVVRLVKILTLGNKNYTKYILNILRYPNAIDIKKIDLRDDILHKKGDIDKYELALHILRSNNESK